MTIKAFEESQKTQLLRIVAEEFPVFVLGPGCYRVGYDNPQNHGWSDIEQRVAELLCQLREDEQVFLREFFFSKLSYERRFGRERTAAAERLHVGVVKAEAQLEQEREQANANDQINSDQTSTERAVEALRSFGPWRTLLATQILRAFRHASCCLGLVIGTGRSPVLHWQEAAVPTELVAKWSQQKEGWKSSGEAEAHSAEDHFRGSRQAIRAARQLARTMLQLSEARPITNEQSAALGGLSLARAANLERSVPASLVSALTSPLEVLLPYRMAAMLDVLESRCFNSPFEPLRGANVEWLGDLLWHVISSDAEVQPSQADLAFYVTLSEQWSPQLPNLRRPDYGDRTAGNDDITRLTTCSQPDEGPVIAGQESMLRTIAACLLAQYQVVQVAQSVTEKYKDRIMRGEGIPPEDKPLAAPAGRYIIALAGDYGDRFERALLDLLDRKAQFHVAVPVWLGTARGTRKIDWLLATVGKDVRGDPVIGWAWLAEVDEVGGPIVIKQNGCDRSPLGAQEIRGNVSEFPVESPTERHMDTSMELAVLYDEHDRLTAMQSFDELIGDVGNKCGLVSGLNNKDNGLTWRGRSWVIMGQRFADWIPRLSLFTRKWLGERDNKTERQTSYWAIDRAYDWPERSLLESLGITMIEGELGAVAKTLTADAFHSRRKNSPLSELFDEVFDGAVER